MIRQILLSLPTYPDAPPEQTMQGAVLLAQSLGASLTVQIPQLSSDPETWPPIIGTFPLDFPNMMKEAVLQSERNATNLAETVTRVCAAAKVPLDMRRSLSTLLASPEYLVDLARLHDLTILPVPEISAFDHDYLEAALFGTGHPVLLLPSGKNSRPLRGLEKVVVAWDYSLESARALSDAMPILARAKLVHIVSVMGEKTIRTTSASSDLEKYLTAHKVNYAVEQIALNGSVVADRVLSLANGANADLLVMGAYGHSRLQEFIMGGATQEILADTRLPVLFSH